MGAATSVDRSELAGLSATEIADLASAFNPGVAEHRQMLIDFGVNGEMLVQLPRHQLADMLHRPDISRAHLGSLLGELDKVIRVTRQTSAVEGSFYIGFPDECDKVTCHAF